MQGFRPWQPAVMGMGVTWSPAALGLDLWLDHASGVARSGSAWTSWTSVVGGHVFSQGTGASQPVDRTIGAFIVPDFDGTDDFLQGPLYSAIFGGTLSPIGIAAVIYVDALGPATGFSGDGIFTTLSSARHALTVGTSTVHHCVFDSGGNKIATAGSAIATATTTLVRGDYDNASAITATCDGGSAGSTAAGAHFAGNFGFNAIVGRTGSVGAAASLDGAIFAIFARRTVFSAGELASLAAYCSARWGAV